MYVLSAATNHILNSSHVYVFKKIMNIILPHTPHSGMLRIIFTDTMNNEFTVCISNPFIYFPFAYMQTDNLLTGKS